MAANVFVLGLLCLVAIGSGRQPAGHLLISEEDRARKRLIRIAVSQLQVREATGKNDGTAVEAYLALTGLKKGNPWCAAFISWVFAQAGYPAPRTAWSPALFTAKVKTKEIKPANILGIWFADLGRIAHVGMVERREGDWVISIEGNTNTAASREGDGVYRKRRHIKSIYAYADWTKQKGAIP